ncbi:MAG: TolC family protein, partial [Limnobacter sp.]|nr:TolC family protein [Limnobacter sp.]
MPKVPIPVPTHVPTQIQAPGQSNRRRLSAVASLLLTLGLTGCASYVELLTPRNAVPTKIPDTVLPEGVNSVEMSEVQNEAWWKLVEAPPMHATIELALQHNTDLRLARERINEAGALLGIARADQWPAIVGEINYNRNRPTQAGNVPVFGARNVYESTKVALSASWELDLWGRTGR